MKKEEIQEKLDKLNKEYSLKEKEIENSPEYLKLKKKYSSLDKETDALYEKERKIERDIYEKFLDDGEHPRYTNTENNSRNIRKDVLNSIKRGSGIKNLSLLKANDIEKIVKKLIDKEINGNDELRNVTDRKFTKGEEMREVRREMDKLKDKLTPLEKEISDLNRKFREAERIEERAKELENPKKRDYLKTEKRKEEAQRHLRANFNDIVEKVRVEVIKEKIVNNLEDEKD